MSVSTLKSVLGILLCVCGFALGFAMISAGGLCIAWSFDVFRSEPYRLWAAITLFCFGFFICFKCGQKIWKLARNLAHKSKQTTEQD